MKQQLLVIGAGFGGLWSTLSAARLLDMHDRHDVQITLLAPQAELRIRPRFYEPDVPSMYAPLDALLDAVGVRFVKGTAQSVDSQARRVGYRDEAGRPGELTYDRLVLASGSQLARPPVPGLKEHAFDVDQIESEIRVHRERALEIGPERRLAGDLTGRVAEHLGRDRRDEHDLVVVVRHDAVHVVTVPRLHPVVRQLAHLRFLQHRILSRTGRSRPSRGVDRRQYGATRGPVQRIGAVIRRN